MVNRTDKISFFLLKVMYFYAKAFSMVHFSIKMGDKPQLIYSIETKFLPIVCRLACLIVYTALLPSVLKDVKNMLSRKTSLDNYLVVILSMQYISIVVYTIALISFNLARHKQFVKVVNRAIDIFVRISKLAKSKHIFTIDFCLMISFRLFIVMHAAFTSVPHVYDGVLSGKYVLVLEWMVESYLWIGTLIVLDTCFIGYTAFAAMYKNTADYISEFVGRLEIEDMQTISKSRRRRLLRTFSKQLEECTLIYSEIFKIINDFHGLFQFNILYTFYIDFINVVVLAHYSFWTYLIKGEVVSDALIAGGVRALEALLLVITADKMVRTSRIPKYLNWDHLYSDVDKRWDRAVDQFLNILRFQDLKIEICGLFQLNNELCLRVLSVTVAYVTILFQFSLLGYFHAEDYAFIEDRN